MFWGDWWSGDRATSGDNGSRIIGVGDHGPFGLGAGKGDRLSAWTMRPAWTTSGSLFVESHGHGSTAAPMALSRNAGSVHIRGHRVTDGVCPCHFHLPVTSPLLMAVLPLALGCELGLGVRDLATVGIPGVEALGVPEPLFGRL